MTIGWTADHGNCAAFLGSPRPVTGALCILIMPDCTTISCSFDKRDRAGLARAIYSSSFDDSVAFDGVLPWAATRT